MFAGGLFDLRGADEWLADTRPSPTPRKLCGGLWREGELAILFGAKGMGKSLLATQIAEAVSRGEGVGPMECETDPQTVLYLDLKLTAIQFTSRYRADADAPFAEEYEFSKGLKRVAVDIHADVPEGCRSFSEYFCRSVSQLVESTGAKVLVIDNITHLKHSNDVVRDTLPLMRELNRLKKETGLSVLVVAQSQRRISRNRLTIDDLQSAKMLGTFADSVFAIGDGGRGGDQRYIKHLNSRSGEVLYDHTLVPACRIEKIDGNFLGMVFGSLVPEAYMYGDYRETRDWQLIDRIKQMHDDEDKTIREIAEDLEMSKTTVHRLLNMWCEPQKAEPPAPEADPNYFPGQEEYDLALEDPRFDGIFREDTYENRLLRRESYLIEAARGVARRAYQANGIAPPLASDPTYSAFIQQVKDSTDSTDPTDSTDSTDPTDSTDSIDSTDSTDPIDSETDYADPENMPERLKALHIHRLIYRGDGLTHEIDPYGRNRWVDEYDERGKPKSWYAFDNKDNLFHSEKRPEGRFVTLVDKRNKLVPEIPLD